MKPISGSPPSPPALAEQRPVPGSPLPAHAGLAQASPQQNLQDPLAQLGQQPGTTLGGFERRHSPSAGAGSKRTSAQANLPTGPRPTRVRPAAPPQAQMSPAAVSNANQSLDGIEQELSL